MSGFLDARRTRRSVFYFLDDDPVTRAFVSSALFTFALFVVTVPPWLIDTRTLDGVSVWLKPQKFNVSMVVHFMTLAILAQQLPRPVRAGPTLGLFAYLAVGSMVLEQVYMHIQAARGRKSHFNYETEIEALMYSLMGVGALLLVIVAIVMAIQIWRKGQRELPGLRLGTILGLTIAALSTIAFAGYMSISGSRWVGEHPPGGAEIPFFAWSREVGDLRPAHFVTLHVMQTLPIIGYMFDRFGGPARAAVIAAGVAQLALAAGLFYQALSGAPFWPAN